MASVGAYGIVSPYTPHRLFRAWDLPFRQSNTNFQWHNSFAIVFRYGKMPAFDTTARSTVSRLAQIRVFDSARTRRREVPWPFQVDQPSEKLIAKSFVRIQPSEKTMAVSTRFDLASFISRRRRRGCADVGSVLRFPHLHSLFSFGLRKNTWVSRRIPHHRKLLMLRVRFQVSPARSSQGWSVIIHPVRSTGPIAAQMIALQVDRQGAVYLTLF